jgi:hypothetical protein
LRRYPPTSGNIREWELYFAEVSDFVNNPIENIADGAITLAKYASGTRPIQLVSVLPTLPDADYPPNEAVVLCAADGKLWRNAAGAWTNALPTTDLTGQITTTQITNEAVTTAQIKANTIVGGNIASQTITGGLIAANQIAAGHMVAGTITANEIASDTITAKNLVVSDRSNMVLNPDFAGGDSTHWGLSGAGTEVLAKDASGVPAGCPMEYCMALVVENANMSTFWYYPDAGEVLYCSLYAALGSGTAANVGAYIYVVHQNDSVTGVGFTGTDLAGSDEPWQIMEGQATLPSTVKKVGIVVQRGAGTAKAYVTNVKVRRAAHANLIVDGAITTDKLYAQAVTSAKIYSGAVAADLIQAGNIAAGTITSDRLYSGAVAANLIQAANIAAGVITSDLLYAGAVSANLIQAGNIAAGVITSDLLYAGAVAANLIQADNIAAGIITATHIGTNEIIAQTANIKDGVISSAKINDLSATKITSGTISSAAITVTGGGITISGGGSIKGGQTDYATGTGFFLGYSGGYKFSIGSSTNYVRWDGSTLSLGGSIVASGNIQGTTLSSLKTDMGTLTAGTIQSSGFTAPGANPGSGLKINCTAGTIEAYGSGHAFGGAMVSMTTTDMVTIGCLLKSAYFTTHYPAVNSTYFTFSAESHNYVWSGSAWVEVFGYSQDRALSATIAYHLETNTVWTDGNNTSITLPALTSNSYVRLWFVAQCCYSSGTGAGLQRFRIGTAYSSEKMGVTTYPTYTSDVYYLDLYGSTGGSVTLVQQLQSAPSGGQYGKMDATKVYLQVFIP